MARFRGINRLADFDDNRREWGRAARFLREHVPIAGRVPPDSWIREDRPRYPPRATRDALANAICHRDDISGEAVTVTVDDDHLENTNPGSLPFRLTPEDLTRLSLARSTARASLNAGDPAPLTSSNGA